MPTIETMIAEYEQLKKERAAALTELQSYRDRYDALARQLGMDPGELLQMNVISAEMQRQEWSMKEILVIALEKEIIKK